MAFTVVGSRAFNTDAIESLRVRDGTWDDPGCICITTTSGYTAEVSDEDEIAALLKACDCCKADPKKAK